MDTSTTKYRICQCSECPNGMEYTCVTCSCDLCLQCRDVHVIKMLAKGDIHNVLKYWEKSKSLNNREICLRHPSSVYNNYCEVCNIPICPDFIEHTTHTITDVKTAYITKRRQKGKMIQKLAEEEKFWSTFYLVFELDFKILSENIADINSKLLTLSKTLTDCCNNLLNNCTAKIRCLKQTTKINRCIARTQLYEHTYEHSSIVPVKFLSLVKKTRDEEQGFFKTYWPGNAHSVIQHRICHWEIA